MGRLKIKKHALEKYRTKKQAIQKQASKNQMAESEEKYPLEINGEAAKEKKFYEMPWFWVCVTIIVVCITRPLKIVICGNGNGSGNDNGNNNGNHNANNNGANRLKEEILRLCETEK